MRTSAPRVRPVPWFLVRRGSLAAGFCVLRPAMHPEADRSSVLLKRVRTPRWCGHHEAVGRWTGLYAGRCSGHPCAPGSRHEACPAFGVVPRSCSHGGSSSLSLNPGYRFAGLRFFCADSRRTENLSHRGRPSKVSLNLKSWVSPEEQSADLNIVIYVKSSGLAIFSGRLTDQCVESSLT